MKNNKDKNPSPSFKNILISFFQALAVMIAVGVFIIMIWLPPREGRNFQAPLFSVYFKDPFLVYIYLGSVPFFVGVYQSLKLLECLKRRELKQPAIKHILRNIKYCAFLTAILIIGAEIFIHLGDTEDSNALGFFAILLSLIIGIAAAEWERI
jgi:hypothetical protein